MTLARGRRVLLTILTASVGVAIVGGTLVLTDTVNRAFRDLFSGGARGAQVIVASRHLVDGDTSAGTPVPGALVGRIRRLAGVSAAAGQISQVAAIVARDGSVVSGGRLPTAALSYLPAPFEGMRIVRGLPPRGPDEVALDLTTAQQQGYRVGDLVSVVTAQPARRFRIAGLARLGGGIGGERFVVFDPRTARTLYDLGANFDLIDVALAPGVRPFRVAAEIGAVLPPGLVARSRADAVAAQVHAVDVRFRALTRGLLAFAVIAVLVGALMVAAAFAGLGAARAGDLAVLRALGATRGQLCLNVLQEALVVGVAAAGLGLGLGLLVALGLRAVLDASGSNLPSGGLVIPASAALACAGSGLGVALIAAVAPAARAARLTPIDGLRAAVLPRGVRGRRLRAVVVAALGSGGLALILTAHGGTAARLQLSAAGAALVIGGTLLGGPLVIGWLARWLAWPVIRRDPMIGELAREQIRQNPTRAALTASSLTTGLALVLLLAVYTSALQGAAHDAVRQTVRADVAIESQDGVSPIPASAVQAAATAPGVTGLASLRTARADLGADRGVAVSGIDPTVWPLVYRFRWVRGSNRLLARLAVGQVLVEQDTARTAGLSVGDQAWLRTGSGQRVKVTVAGIYSDPGLLAGAVMSEPWFATLFNQPRPQAVFVKFGAGAANAVELASLRTSLARFPGVVARSATQLAAHVQGGVSGIVDLLYALLGLSLLMALVGIAGTLNLSILERGRELGMLRAVGMSRSQAQQLVRFESVIIAGAGCLTALVVGLVLGWSVTHALSAEGAVFTVPWLMLVACVGVGLLAGFLAAIPPARRATRLDVLAAIAQE